MNDNVPLYNSRLTKNYLDYIGRHHPDVNLDSVLDYAGMIRYEVRFGSGLCRDDPLRSGRSGSLV
jgi:hypothetical protein